jgi:glycosyltransferase involved in cell wall biosynthesis
LSKIAVATCDALTAKKAGPGIRAWQIASTLAAEHEVQLVTTSRATAGSADFPVRSLDDKGLREIEAWCDVLVFQGWLITGRPFLLKSDKVLVADVYDPLHLEQLEQARDIGEEARRHTVRRATEVLNEQLMRADFMMCASTRQRDFWLGHLAGLGRLNPVAYDDDDTLRSLIEVVPFGIPDEPPVPRRQVLKGVLPGVERDDKVILWGGGIYNWFDPLTLLHAVDRLRRRMPNVRLVFMGLRHPNPDIPEMRAALEAREVSARLGLTGTHVFFNEGWIDYDDRVDWLMESDVGVSTHLAHLETALSFRTRVLDYIWASLPVVATRGDVLAEVVDAHELGISVEPRNVAELETALFRLLDDDVLRKTCEENEATLAPSLRWSKALAPLVEFCRHPRRAPDLLDQDTVDRLRRDFGPPPAVAGWRRELRIAAGHLREGGPRQVVNKALGRVRRLRGATPGRDER